MNKADGLAYRYQAGIYIAIRPDGNLPAAHQEGSKLFQLGMLAFQLSDLFGRLVDKSAPPQAYALAVARSARQQGYGR